jgi:hypothetical protein
MVAGTKTFAGLSQLSAQLMRSTARVGDPNEDASMKRARPMLSRINALGLVTTESQMGMKSGRMTHWQRAFVSGICTKATADKLFKHFLCDDSVLVFVFPHASDLSQEALAQGLSMPRLAMTVINGNAETRMPLGASPPYSSTVSNLLPEVKAVLFGEHRSNSSSDVSDLPLIQKIRAQTVTVQVVDVKWGRKLKLFELVEQALSA